MDLLKSSSYFTYYQVYHLEILPAAIGGYLFVWCGFNLLDPDFFFFLVLAHTVYKM